MYNGEEKHNDIREKLLKLKRIKASENFEKELQNKLKLLEIENKNLLHTSGSLKSEFLVEKIKSPLKSFVDINFGKKRISWLVPSFTFVIVLFFIFIVYFYFIRTNKINISEDTSSQKHTLTQEKSTSSLQENQNNIQKQLQQDIITDANNLKHNEKTSYSNKISKTSNTDREAPPKPYAIEENKTDIEKIKSGFEETPRSPEPKYEQPPKKEDTKGIQPAHKNEDKNIDINNKPNPSIKEKSDEKGQTDIYDKSVTPKKSKKKLIDEKILEEIKKKVQGKSEENK